MITSVGVGGWALSNSNERTMRVHDGFIRVENTLVTVPKQEQQQPVQISRVLRFRWK